MMGGGGKVPRAEITAEEIAYAEVAQKTWDQYLETGIPAENEYIRRSTGYVFNESTGEHEIDPEGPLNEDGTLKTDASAARTAAEVAAVQQQHQGDPNRPNTRPGVLADVDSAISAEVGQNLGQQTSLLQGVDNSVALLKGEEFEAAQSMRQLAGQAQQTAMQNANIRQQRRESNAYLGGSIAGAGTSLLMSRTPQEKPAAPRQSSSALPPTLLAGRPS